MPGERLQTVLARAGVGSRRAADRWIGEGRITVNGQPAEPGVRIDPERDIVTLDGRRLDLVAPAAVHLAIHKPRGVLSSASSAHGQRAIVDLVEPRPAGRLWPTGRLDLDSEGLMLLTNDGSWAQRVLHPRYGLLRQYAVQLDRELEPSDVHRLRTGVELDGVPASLLSVRPGRRPPQVEPIEPGPWYRVELGEGRNREVRRLFAVLDYRVLRLVRVGYGPITLAGLGPAAWRPLTAAEVADLAGGVPETTPTPPPRRAKIRNHLRIAVDGTSGSGKSTVGRALAERLDARFVDTGLLYRAVTLIALEQGVEPADGPAVAHLARTTPIRVRAATGRDRGQGDRVTIRRRDVTELLREPRIERAVPTVSQHPDVRAAMLTVQRDAALGADTVMVGRDIGTVVLPDADLKVFLTASVETRARRRAAQMGTPGRLAAYQREITERDRTDSTRAVAPLRRAPGALVLDTGELDVAACVTAIVAALPPRSAA